jgi:biopolymer transport protein ExbD/biopolymer transport protein TolR
MSMNMAGASGGGRRGRRRAAVMAEINVTPMVDVMLVLLIIFMVAAQLMTSTIDIDLPVASGGKSLASNALTLSVKRTGGSCNSNIELYLGDTLISAAELQPKIKAIRDTRSDADSVVYLRGDKDVCYTDMMKLLGYIRTAGFKANIVIVPEGG